MRCRKGGLSEYSQQCGYQCDVNRSFPHSLNELSLFYDSQELKLNPCRQLSVFPALGVSNCFSTTYNLIILPGGLHADKRIKSSGRFSDTSELISYF